MFLRGGLDVATKFSDVGFDHLEASVDSNEFLVDAIEAFVHPLLERVDPLAGCLLFHRLHDGKCNLLSVTKQRQNAQSG